MATDSRALLAFLGTDADFRLWAAGIEAQLVACGLVVTSDTGQLVIASAIRPGTAAYAGYRVYRFSDTLQATKPIFIKVEYGIGTSADRPALRITTGSATNGAGTLSGNGVAAVVAAAQSSKTSTVTLTSYCAGDGSRIALASNIDLAATLFKIGFIMDRTRDASGAATGDGYWIYIFGSSVVHSVIPSTGSPPSTNTAESVLPTIVETANGRVTTFGSNVALYPFFAIMGQPFPLLALVAYKHVDIGEGVQFTGSSWLGASRTWMPLGDGGPLATTAAQAIAILWE